MNFRFQGIGEHDFRPCGGDDDDDLKWLECVYCGTVLAREAEGLIGAMFDCYQEQLLQDGSDGADHSFKAEITSSS